MKCFLNNAVTHLQKMGSGNGSATLIIAVCLLLTSPLLAVAGYGSTVTISSWDQKPFILELDNKRYHADGVISLNNIRPGKIRMRMIRERNTQSHSNYGNQGRGNVLYNGFVDVPKNSKVKARVDRNRRIKVTHVIRNRHNKPAINKPRRPARPSGGQCATGNTPNAELDVHNDPQQFQPYSYEETGSYGGACAMKGADFEELLYAIDNACFSDQKVRVARQALRHQHITVLQLEEIIRMMDFSSNELEVAKLGYERVIDKHNTWKIYDAFSFSSTAREFEEFVCQH